MKKYIHFLGLLLLLPFLIFLAEYSFSLVNLYEKVNLIPGSLSLIIACLMIVVLFYKNIKIKQLYNEINLTHTLLFAIISAFFIYVITSSIEVLYQVKENYTLKPVTFTLEALISILLFAPILEELVCRVIIINRFFTKIPVWLLITGTSLLFAFLHIKNMNLVISTFLFGVILGYFFIRTKNALLLVLVHFFYNSLFVITNSNDSFYKMNLLFDFTAKYPLWTIITITIVLTLTFGIFRKYLDKWLLKTKK